MPPGAGNYADSRYGAAGCTGMGSAAYGSIAPTVAEPPSGAPAPAAAEETVARDHELRVVDQGSNWRLIYRIDSDAIVILGMFRKTSRGTPTTVIEACRRRLRAYDYATEGQG